MADDTNTMIDIQMEMRAKETIQIGQDLTPPLPPLSFSLYDSSLSSHCSSCFHSLSTTTTTFLHYCSNGGCSAIDAPLHFSSAEHHLFLLLRSRPSLFPHPDSSDLRASLRLLHRFPSLSPPLSPRLFGLLSNRHKLLADDESFARVRDGARAMAMARAMRDGREFNGGDCDCELEEVVLCLVITNAVEVNVDGERPIGIGVYDWRFSWINHSCSPNSCYRFVAAFKEVPMGADSTPSMRIVACGDEVAEIDDTVACSPLELVKAHGNYGLRIIIRSIKGIQSGEEVTITYTDLLQPTALRRSDLLLKYQFICNCKRCCAEPQTYVDLALQVGTLSYEHCYSWTYYNMYGTFVVCNLLCLKALNYKVSLCNLERKCGNRNEIDRYVCQIWIIGVDVFVLSGDCWLVTGKLRAMFLEVFISPELHVSDHRHSDEHGHLTLQYWPETLTVPCPTVEQTYNVQHLLSNPSNIGHQPALLLSGDVFTMIVSNLYPYLLPMNAATVTITVLCQPCKRFCSHFSFQIIPNKCMRIFYSISTRSCYTK